MLLFLVLLVMAARPMLPEVVGETIWPRLLAVRARGRGGLFASWLVYYLMVLVAWAALVAILALFGAQVAVRPWQAAFIGGWIVLLASVQTFRNVNPSRDWDAWLREAHALLKRLDNDDRDHNRSQAIDPSSNSVGSVGLPPSQEYLDHLHRLRAAALQSTDVDLTAKDVALDLLQERIYKVQDALKVRNAKRPA